MTYRVVITARARADTLEAFRWKAEHSAKVAARWLTGLEKVIADLGTSPDRHPVAEEEFDLFGTPLRLMIYGKKPGTFRILFSIEGDMVVLQYVRHGARGLIDPDVE